MSGTGPGLVAAAAAERGADVIGIDFSEEMVAEARRLHPDIEFRKAAAESLPFDDGKFDSVVGNFVLHHSGKPGEVLREAFRVLHGGARVGFTVWTDPHEAGSVRVVLCRGGGARRICGTSAWSVVRSPTTLMSSIRWSAVQVSVTRL